MSRLTFITAIAALSVFLTIESSAQCPNPKSVIQSEWDVVKAGETVRFEIRQPYGDLDKIGYVWAVTNGTIVSGQLTNQIVVSTSPTALQTNEPILELKPDDKHGLIVQGPIGPRSVLLNVVANSISKAGCSNARLNLTIAIGVKSTVASHLPAAVTGVLLSQTEPMIVEVSTEARGNENDRLVYIYTVTAGKIVGSGQNVKWDLTGVLPGTYEIKVGVDDGCGVCGKMVTKTFTLK